MWLYSAMDAQFVERALETNRPFVVKTASGKAYEPLLTETSIGVEQVESPG